MFPLQQTARASSTGSSTKTSAWPTQTQRRPGWAVCPRPPNLPALDTHTFSQLETSFARLVRPEMCRLAMRLKNNDTYPGGRWDDGRSMVGVRARSGLVYVITSFKPTGGLTAAQPQVQRAESLSMSAELSAVCQGKFILCIDQLTNFQIAPLKCVPVIKSPCHTPAPTPHHHVLPTRNHRSQ